MDTNGVPSWDRPLMKILLQDLLDFHEAVEASPLIARLREADADRRDYMRYLVQVHADVSAYEDHLSRLDEAGELPREMAALDLRAVRRKEAMGADIAAWSAVVDPMEPAGCAVGHRRHFDVLARRAPVLLAAHASVRYLAVLFGGQHRLRRLREMWGPAVPSASYEFAGPVAETRAAFCRQANQFYALLGPVTRRAFYDELITAWEFAAHTLGGDVSGLAREHRERLGLTSARMALA